MAKISTKQPDDFDVIHSLLIRVLENHRELEIDPNTDIVDLISMIDATLEGAITAVGEQHEALQILGNKLHQVSYKLTEAANMLEKLTSVPYDDTLDHIAIDFMDRVVSTGAAEISDDGEAIVLDSSVSLTKADIKPLLRETINGWLELKSNE